MWRESARRLPSNASVFVMATGILFTALSITGRQILSAAFQIIAVRSSLHGACMIVGAPRAKASDGAVGLQATAYRAAIDGTIERVHS